MVLLSLQEYDKKIAPFLRNGVIIDTSVILEILKGVIYTQRNTSDTGWKTEYEKIVNLLELIKLTDWRKFFLTPHVMTETCAHINNGYNSDRDFEEIVRKVMAIVKDTQEQQVNKKDFMGRIDYRPQMVLEPGDLSIYAIADSFQEGKKRIAILAKDEGFSTKYQQSPYVMVIDYRLLMELETD